MGLFGGSKKTYVSSVVYNMAGEPKDRPDFLKTTISNIQIQHNPDIAQAIQNTYLHGPGMNFRSFARWTRTSGFSNTMGLVQGSLRVGNSINTQALAAYINQDGPRDSAVFIQTASIGLADYTYWADQQVAQAFPGRLATEYTADFDEATGDILIDWHDPGEQDFSFHPIDFRRDRQYLYASYFVRKETDRQPVVRGTTHAGLAGFPDTSTGDWVAKQSETYPTGESHLTWERTQYQGQATTVDATYATIETLHRDQTASSSGSSVSWRIDTQIVNYGRQSPVQIFIYGQRTGNSVLDLMFNPTKDLGQFLPFIPLRIDNLYVKERDQAKYEISKKALKKAIGGDYDELIQKIDDNPSIGDIDYAYVVFGTPLNTQSNSSRRYIYKFFQTILNQTMAAGGVGGPGSSAAYSTWGNSWDQANVKQQAWNAWKVAQSDVGNALYGTPEPPQAGYPAPPLNQVQVRSDGSGMNFNMTVKWNVLQEFTGTGQLVGFKTGDVQITVAEPTVTRQESTWLPATDASGALNGFVKTMTNAHSDEGIWITWQDSPNTWRKLRLIGVEHVNMIYGGKAVSISGHEALADQDESGFIIPLHEGIFRDLGLKYSTQMSLSSSLLVFNCYQVVKQKWYQTGLFKIVIIIVVIIIAIYTAGAGAAAAGAATSSSVGATVATAAGLAAGSMAALIVAGIVNAVVAMVVTSIIQKAAVAVFGEKIGMIVGIIVSFYAMGQINSMASGGGSMTFSQSIAQIAQPANLLKLTMAVGDAYSAYMGKQTQDILGQTQQVQQDFQQQTDEIQKLWDSVLGHSDIALDPFGLMEASESTQPHMMEPSEAFLNRTLLTGSEIAQMSIDLVLRTPELSLSTQLG